jgi:WD40 repeat protein
LSADGRFALSGGFGNVFMLWDVTSGNCLRTFEGHGRFVDSVCLSADGRYALSLCTSADIMGNVETTLGLWFLDWELEERDPADWDEGARPYLEIFLTLHTPYTSDGFTRRGKPVWSETDFQQLLHTLGCAGYGWLRPEGVRRKLEEMARER